jgi:hypothetical protein
MVQQQQHAVKLICVILKILKLDKLQVCAVKVQKLCQRLGLFFRQSGKRKQW